MAAHGGNAKKRALKNKKNGSRTKTSTKQAYRVYCGFCGVKAPNEPNANPFIHVASGQHFYVCPNGHRGVVGGHSYAGERPFDKDNKEHDLSKA